MSISETIVGEHAVWMIFEKRWFELKYCTNALILFAELSFQPLLHRLNFVFTVLDLISKPTEFTELLPNVEMIEP
jgi:hypothetical protein